MSRRAILTLASLATASALRNDGAIGHVIRTALVAECLAELVGMDAREQATIRLVTPVHDIGKLAIADAVLLKPGRLDSHERAAMERHSEIGADFLAGSADGLLQFDSQIARSHHEHFDGTGYPLGLSGEDLPLAVRVVAVADTFDAMTEDRCYHPGMADDSACEVLAAGRNTHFDPNVVSAFLAGFTKIRAARQKAAQLLASGAEQDVVAAFYALR